MFIFTIIINDDVLNVWYSSYMTKYYSFTPCTPELLFFFFLVTILYNKSCRTPANLGSSISGQPNQWRLNGSLFIDATTECQLSTFVFKREFFLWYTFSSFLYLSATPKVSCSSLFNFLDTIEIVMVYCEQWFCVKLPTIQGR